jgi:vitamin-K-epoxide reductase (warfarin-sensitive)
MLIILLALFGFLVSCYGYMVERRLALEKGYRPLCDVNAVVRCSGALTSKYGHLLFGVSNALMGMLFYAAVIILAVLGLDMVLVPLLILAAVGSLYLGYILYVKIKEICLVCSGIYLVNLLLLIAWFI